MILNYIIWYYIIRYYITIYKYILIILPCVCSSVDAFGHFRHSNNSKNMWNSKHGNAMKCNSGFPNPDHTWSYMIGSKFVIKSLINWANWAHKPMPSIAIPCCVLALRGTNANDSKAGTKECTLCARGNTREKETLEGLSGVHGISWYLKVFHQVSWCCFMVFP